MSRNLIYGIYLRYKARKAQRRLPRESRRAARAIAAEAYRECDTIDEVEEYAAARAAATKYTKANGRELVAFGIAEILLVIQFVVIVYKLLKAFGVLSGEVDDGRVFQEVGE